MMQAHIVERNAGRLLRLCLVAVAWADGLAAQALPPGSVLTQHNDNARTGAYLAETILNVHNVAPHRFGKLFSRSVDGQIYAQPLYLPAVRLPDGSVHNVVYVATMRNLVYAFDADDPSPAGDHPLWSAALGTPLPYNFMHMTGAFGHFFNIKPSIGITSTPVISPERGSIYLVAKVCEESDAQRCTETKKIGYWLHALDLLTGKDQPNSPVRIEATCKGKGETNAHGVISFDPVRHLQRAGLLLANNNVYLAFGSHQDTPHFRGWLLAYDAATLHQSAAFCTTPDGKDGSIWQAGGGPAADNAGNLYVMTGNGTFDTTRSRHDLGTSFVKLSPALELLDWFTPANVKCLNLLDADLGSAGPLLIPGTRLVTGGGKEGVLYLLDGDNLGHLQPANSRAVHDKGPCARSGDSDDPPPLQAFQAAPHWSLVTHPFPIPVFGYHHIHGAPVFWDSPASGPLLYEWAERDYLRAWRFDRATQRFTDTSPPGANPQSSYRSEMTNAVHGMPGAMLSLSADAREGTANWSPDKPRTGILWASMPIEGDAFIDTVDGVLRAFDASDLTELWNSAHWLGDSVGSFAKYCSPTIANGKVYLATFSNRLNVYGILP